MSLPDLGEASSALLIVLFPEVHFEFVPKGLNRIKHRARDGELDHMQVQRDHHLLSVVAVARMLIQHQDGWLVVPIPLDLLNETEDICSVGLLAGIVEVGRVLLGVLAALNDGADDGLPLASAAACRDLDWVLHRLPDLLGQFPDVDCCLVQPDDVSPGHHQ